MSTLISKKFTAWQAECEARFQQLKANEEELNRIFIDIYGLQDELTPEVADYIQRDLSRIERADLLTVVKASGLHGWTKQPDKPSVPDPQPQPGRTYTVQPGDSWWRIAAQQLGSGSRMGELAAANGMAVTDTIHPGQVLALPG